MAEPDQNSRSTDEELAERDETSYVNRRTVLKTTGAVTAAAAASLGIGNAAAEDSTAAYGEGGYGADGYGTNETDSSLVLSTGQASNVTDTAATLSGSVTDLGGASSVDIAIEYRPVGGSWSTTAAQTLTTATSFSQSVSGLSSGTDYEFRATGLSSDGETDTGGVSSFTTSAETTTTSAPTVSRFNVSEAGRPDPHAELTVVWNAGDTDGDLATVTIKVSDADGTVDRSTEWSFSGVGNASDTDEYIIKKGGNATYTVTITATDTAGNTVSERVTVSA